MGPWAGLAGAVQGRSLSEENEADFIKQSSVLEAGEVFHCSLQAQLALIFFLIAKHSWFSSGLDSPCAALVGTGKGRKSQ